ncbi:MAG: YbjQ family protein [Lachnospiraceae bacterium]|nr:YbjQ family protein [Lachnospiraceae bacterium]
MILSTIEHLPGRQYEILGVVKGCIVNTKHVGKDIGASFKTIVGGELKGYTEMLEEARQAADSRMIQAALNMGADAIIGIRYSTSSIMPGAAEIMVYGTAVRFTE